MKTDPVYDATDFARDIDVSRETLDALTLYADQLAKWQKAKNLVANSTIDDRWRRHFLDSAQLYPLIRKYHPKGNLALLDIGSGAGFPGLVLSIMGLGSVELVESNGRKCVFMNQVARATAAPAKALNERIEALPSRQVDIICSRACAKVVQLLDWSEPFISETTEMWLLKGEGAEEELTQAAASWNMSVERFDSLSSSTGTILRLSRIKRR